MKENKNEQKERKGLRGKMGWAIGGAVILLAIAVVLVCLAGGESAPEKPTFKVETPYIDLLVPLELEGIITSDESTYGNIYTRGFYMNYNGKEQPLWRVDFGDANSGDWIGRLITEAGDIPVAMTGFAITNEELTAMGEEGSQLYGECMQAYGVMMDGIMADPRFTTERPLAIGEDTKVRLKHWTVTLPSNMTVQETSSGDGYEAIFTGEVVGEVVQLYRVRLGGEQTGSLLGYYKIDGVKEPIFVESFTLAERENWNAEDYETAYRMMSTINDVIQQITASKNYSEYSEK